MNWQSASMLIGALAAALHAFIAYKGAKNTENENSKTRSMQDKAWQQVLDGELSEASINGMTIKAPPKENK